MKKLLLLPIAFLTIGVISCQKDKSITSNIASTSIKSIQPGDYPIVKTMPYVWKINSFIVNGIDITAQFANYKFQFNEPLIIATDGINTFYGKWEINSNLLTLNFPSAVPVPASNFTNDINPSIKTFVLSELNEEWTIKQSQLYDMILETATKVLAFHTDGEKWPG